MNLGEDGRTSPQDMSDRAPAHRRWSLPIGRLFGIQIRVHATFLLIVVLVWAGSTEPGGMGPANAMLWLAVVFVCITAHELSHSVVASSRGIRVRAIVLLPIGGVSEMESMSESASDEFAVSVVGPLTSLAIAIAAGVMAVGAGSPLLPIRLFDGPLLPRIAWFNLVIAMFNMLPAFPLDGGRVLRSLLERTLDREQATHVAARAGRQLAALMVVVGVLTNPWLMVIGLFVWFGATSEEAATVVHARLSGRRARDLMVEAPVVVDASEPVEHLALWVRRTSQQEFPVVEHGHYVGLASVYACGEAPAGAVVGDIMNPEVPAVSPDASLEDEVLPVLAGGTYDALAVVDGGRVVGLLRTEDLARFLRRRAA